MRREPIHRFSYGTRTASHRWDADPFRHHAKEWQIKVKRRSQAKLNYQLHRRVVTEARAWGFPGPTMLKKSSFLFIQQQQIEKLVLFVIIWPNFTDLVDEYG